MPFPRIQLIFCTALLMGLAPAPTAAQVTQAALDATQHALELRIAAASAEASEAVAAQREAEARQARLEAERAALLAQLPDANVRALAGSVETRQFGAAGLVRAFDLARTLAAEVCSALPAGEQLVVHDPAASQGVLAARTVNDTLVRMGEEMSRRNKEMQAYIDAHTPPGAVLASVTTALTVVPALVRAGADTASLFKTDTSASAMAYGEGARALFLSALASTCPAQLAGLGSGYLGELDLAQHERLLGRVRTLAGHRADYANRIAQLQKLADAAKGEDKKELSAVAGAAGVALKTVDAFIESLKAGETGERSPLYNTARYLGYGGRTAGAPVLDFDLRLEGMSIVRDNLFTGQKLRLSGVALLWFRVHAPDGSLRLSQTLRRVARPIEVDLKGAAAGDAFWDGPARP